jgi:hypothetical protein
VNEFGERFDLLIGPGDKNAIQSAGIRKWIPKHVVDKTIDLAVTVKEQFLENGIRCPVWLASQGPRMILESTKVDGVLLNLIDSELVKWALEIMNKKPLFKVGLFTPTKLADSPKSKPSKDILFSAAIVALGASKVLLEKMGLVEEIERARKLHREQGSLSQEVIDEIGVENLLRWGLFSNPKGIVETILNLEKIGIDTIIFGPPVSHDMSSIKMLLEAYEIQKRHQD